MNAEDWYKNLEALRFRPGSSGREVAGTGALDPAVPAVFEHRRALFREVAAKYDIDGIEFDYMRSTFTLVSDHRNHGPDPGSPGDPTHAGSVAASKGRAKLLLGVRVGYSLDGPPAGKWSLSCRDLGLDVRSWVRDKLVDYLCPSSSGDTCPRCRKPGNTWTSPKAATSESTRRSFRMRSGRPMRRGPGLIRPTTPR